MNYKPIMSPISQARAIFSREVFKDLPDGLSREEFMVKYREMIDTITKCTDDPINQLVWGGWLESMANFLAQDLANKVLKGNTKEAEALMDWMVKVAKGEIE